MPNIDIGGISLHYESRGPEGAPTILLVMGLGVQMILWPEPLIDALVARGFRVVRFDNRDVGLSSQLHHLGVPNIGLQYLRYRMHLTLNAPYRIDDMARDTAGLIDALGLGKVHLVGASMGGMICQNVAATFPEKVLSLTSIMSTTGRRSLPQPSWPVTKALLTPPAKKGDTEGAIRRMMHVFRVIGSKSLPAAEVHLREICERHILRANYPPGGARQILAIAASGDRTAVIRTIKVPTLVIHGDEDPLVLPEAGRETARVINAGGGNARLLLLSGMGHDFPLPLIPQISAEIGAFCEENLPGNMGLQ